MNRERFVSYAETLEDLILYHALRDVKNGFYIDAGASDPWELSVTQAFYERGWHGINIEPRKKAFEDIEKYRPNDINFCCGVGDKESKIPFCNELTSFCGDVIKSSKYSNQSMDELEIKTIKTVVDLVKDMPDEVHFFKIDVEGFEQEVLNGIDFDKLRPWVFCLEALPNFGVGWEKTLFENDYLFALQDDINRYYVSKEKSSLIVEFLHSDELLEIYDVWHCERDNYIKRKVNAYKSNSNAYKIGYFLLTPIRICRKIFRR